MLPPILSILFSIILIFLFSDPSEGRKPHDMAEAVAHTGHRPTLPAPDADDWDVNVPPIVQSAWNESPEERPTFLELLYQLEGAQYDEADEGYITDVRKAL